MKILKKIIKQPRPRYVEVPNGSGLRKKKLTYGFVACPCSSLKGANLSNRLAFRMPSTHSACTTFYAFYICCASYFLSLHPTLHTADSWIPFGLKTIIPPFVTLWALSVIQSRVWMEHHTYAQVLVGTIWGGAFAAFWFSLWTRGGLSVFGDQIDIWIQQALLS